MDKVEINPKLIAHRLKLVLDPEVGLNIVDLGLIYDIQCENGNVSVKVTMTTMGCPMTRYIRMSIENVLSKINGVDNTDIELVWSPTWSPKMITPGIFPHR